MKHPRRLDEEDEEGAERRSGIRDRAPAPAAPPDPGPCTSFADAYTRYRQFVWHHIPRRGIDESTVDDVFQVVFVKVDQRIRDKGALPHPADPLLHALINNAVRSLVRTRRRARIHGEPDADTTPSSKPDPEQLLALARDALARKQIEEAAFAKLREDDEVLLRLAGSGDLSHRQIGAIMGRSEGTVAVDLHRARGRFRQVVELLCRLHQRMRGKP